MCRRGFLDKCATLANLGANSSPSRFVASRSRRETHVTSSPTKPDRPRFLWLLASLVLLLLLSPFFKSEGIGGIGLKTLFTLALLSAVYAASARRGYMFVAACFAVPWVLLSWSSVAWERIARWTVLDVSSDLLLIGLNVFTLGVVLVRTVRAKDVDLDILCGAISVYLLLGVTWGVCFRVIETLSPGSFALIDPDVAADWSQLLYFSLTSLTTLGYGDITPLSPVARIWSTLEAVTGVLYIAILVARLVSLYQR